MIDSPQIVQTRDEQYAFIHLVISHSQIQTVLRPTLQQLHDTLTAHGIPVDHPWFAHHLTLGGGELNFEVCLPVDEPFAASGAVRPGVWPAGAVARTVHYGDYPSLPAAWNELRAWIAQSGHVPAKDIYERYVVHQGSTKDPAANRTELSWPLVVSPTQQEQA